MSWRKLISQNTIEEEATRQGAALCDDDAEQNMGTTAWGPPLWKSMHIMALGYKGEDKDSYAAFYVSLANVLPCKVCAQHYAKELEHKPVGDALENGTLFEWTVAVHNSVNKRLGKPEWSVDAAREHYNRLVFYPHRNDTNTSAEATHSYYFSNDQRSRNAAMASSVLTWVLVAVAILLCVLIAFRAGLFAFVTGNTAYSRGKKN